MRVPRSDGVVTPRQKHLGNHVRRFRQEAGLTQEQLAWKAGIHRSYVPQIEQGQRNLTLELICKLAKALKVGASDLVDGCERKKGKP